MQGTLSIWKKDNACATKKGKSKNKTKNIKKKKTALHLTGETHVLSKIEAIPHGLLPCHIPLIGNQEWRAVF